jgi:group I intron endonuclease
MTGVIYIATNLETGKQYVGQSVNFKSRMWHHLHQKGPSYFERSLQNRGAGGFSIVTITYPQDELNYQEKFWIAKLDTMYPNGYNLTAGGLGKIGCRLSDDAKKKISMAHRGRKNTEETKLKMSLAAKGRIVGGDTKEKLRLINLGKKLSPETRAKMSESRTGDKNHFYGKKHTEQTKERMRLVKLGRMHSEETKIKMRKKHPTYRRRTNGITYSS